MKCLLTCPHKRWFVCADWFVRSGRKWQTAPPCGNTDVKGKELGLVVSPYRLKTGVCFTFYVKRRNLLKNPRAEEQFSHWQILENGGDKWNIECMKTPFPDEAVSKFFVTSYCSCKKSQLIDLVKEGYGSAFMDEFEPDITVSDWYAPRFDCGCEYHICVELLNQKKRVIQKFCPDPVYFQQWNDHQWEQMTHVFHDYGPGVRFVRFTHGGKDTQFWAGWYGIRVTNSSVEISPSEDRNSPLNTLQMDPSTGSEEQQCSGTKKIKKKTAML